MTKAKRKRVKGVKGECYCYYYCLRPGVNPSLGGGRESVEVALSPKAVSLLGGPVRLSVLNWLLVERVYHVVLTVVCCLALPVADCPAGLVTVVPPDAAGQG